MKLSSSPEYLDGWQNETILKKDSLQEFVMDYYSKIAGKDAKRYDSIGEFHTSGTNSEVLHKLKAGQANIKEIEVLYMQELPVQLHAVFASEGRGQNIDLYLKGKALQDYIENFT